MSLVVFLMSYQRTEDSKWGHLVHSDILVSPGHTFKDRLYLLLSAESTPKSFLVMRTTSSV